MSETVVDGLKVNILADFDHHAPRGAIVTLSRSVALEMIGRGAAELSSEEEPGVVGELLKHLRKQPMSIVNAAFALGIEVDECEQLLNRLVAHRRVCRTSGARYSQIYWPAA